MAKDNAEAENAGSRAATPVLPPITPEPAEKKDDGEAADDGPAEQDEYLNPNFRSGYTLRADRVIEKLNAIGIEAGALPLPGVTDPETCAREAERRQARKELARRRQLLERYERNREQMISIRKELGCPEDPGDAEESDTMYSEEVVSGLRATVRTMRKDLRSFEKERIAMSKRIDDLERLHSEAESQRRNAEGRVASMKKLVAQAEKRATVFEDKERSFKQELSKNKAEDRESALGRKLQESEQTVLTQEAQLAAVRRREDILKTKVKALRHELSLEKDRMTRLMESPERRKIQAQARGAQARKSADAAMRAATSIQAEYRRKRATRELQAKTKKDITEARKCRARLGEVREELAEMERKRDLAAMDWGSFESTLSSAKQELVDVTNQLQEKRLALTAALTLKDRSGEDETSKERQDEEEYGDEDFE
jgi:chromosome segregation ATPase